MTRLFQVRDELVEDHRRLKVEADMRSQASKNDRSKFRTGSSSSSNISSGTSQYIGSKVYFPSRAEWAKAAGIREKRLETVNEASNVVVPYCDT